MSKKALIVDAAIELFAKKGYEATSIQEITEHCGISKGAFYLSFKSKEELFLAIIDHMIAKIGSSIDQVVKSDIDAQHKLFLYFSHLFEFLNSHRSLATIFNSDRPRQLDQQLLQKIMFYDKHFSQSILDLFESYYGETIAITKYDLVLCVKGLLKGYCEYLIFEQRPVDISSLTQSLVDKINVLALHSKKAFLTKEIFENYGIYPTIIVTLEELQAQIDVAIEQAEQELEKESLLLLKQQLQSDTPNEAIVKGMISNLREFPSSHHIANLLHYYKQQAHDSPCSPMPPTSC